MDYTAVADAQLTPHRRLSIRGAGNQLPLEIVGLCAQRGRGVGSRLVKMKRLVVDLDETLTLPDPDRSYARKLPNAALVARLREYKAAGFDIIIHTARNMRSFEGAIGKINAHTLPVIIRWLDEHHIPYDEVHVGKPWCGTEGFYVDDRAVRPAEFLRFSGEEIAELLMRDRQA